MEYNENMELVLYSMSREIEIIENGRNQEGKPEKFLKFYFKNINELADLINTNPTIVRKLKELLKENDDICPCCHYCNHRANCSNCIERHENYTQEGEFIPERVFTPQRCHCNSK